MVNHEYVECENRYCQQANNYKLNLVLDEQSRLYEPPKLHTITG